MIKKNKKRNPYVLPSRIKKAGKHKDKKKEKNKKKCRQKYRIFHKKENKNV